jgi:hypothetical protein
MFEMIGFHTCQHRGTKEELRGKVPFLSRRENQWLGQGYYFWTELDVWAHDWLGEAEKVISEYSLSVPRDQLLDLVGSLADQSDFAIIIDRFKKKGRLRQHYVKRFGNDFNVASIVMWLREEKDLGFGEIFPYWAVRAKDSAQKRRVPYRKGRPEELFLIERHQMCVYAEHKAAVVKFKRFTHPEHFMEDMEIGELA